MEFPVAPNHPPDLTSKDCSVAQVSVERTVIPFPVPKVASRYFNTVGGRVPPNDSGRALVSLIVRPQLVILSWELSRASKTA